MGASSRRPKNRHIAYKVSKYVPEKRLLDAKSIRKIEAKVPPWGFQCFVESLDAQQRAYLDKSGVMRPVQPLAPFLYVQNRRSQLFFQLGGDLLDTPAHISEFPCNHKALMSLCMLYSHASPQRQIDRGNLPTPCKREPPIRCRRAGRCRAGFKQHISEEL